MGIPCDPLGRKWKVLLVRMTPPSLLSPDKWKKRDAWKYVE